MLAPTTAPLPVTTLAPVTTRPAATQPARGAVLNPHWSATECRACHQMSGDTAQPIPAQSVEAVCVSCHDGRQARREPHPVGRPFGAMTRPADWPAPDDKVTCTTCHLVHPKGDAYAAKPPQNPMFLRGDPPDLLSFCGRCHAGVDAPQHRYNPHTAQYVKSQVVDSSCSFCHTQPMPSGTGAVRTGQPALRADPISLCVGCHQRHLEWSEKSHIGAHATPEILAALAAFSASWNPSASSAQPAASSLPLAGGNIVVCSTCHNPHAAGVFPVSNVLANGAVQPAPAAEQLRGLRSQLCGACHGK